MENTHPTARLKALLTSQIQQIRWHAKLSPETLNIPATPEVTEIQIFNITLKGADIHPDLLLFLDKAIPQPILWMIENADQLLAYSVAHKRPSEADSSQWVVGSRFTSSFTSPASELQPLPAALDLTQLYRSLILPLLPLAAREGESISGLFTRCSDYQLHQRQITQLTAKVNREKQFNRRVELNQELNNLKSKLADLSN